MTAAVTPGRETRLLERLDAGARHNDYPEAFGESWTQLCRDAASAIRRLAAKPADEGWRKALRRLAIVQVHRMAYGGGTVHVGWACKTCDGGWDRDAPEKHKADCPATLSPSGEPKP